VRIRINKDPTVSNNAGFKDEEYQFDSCFGPSTTQDDIFEDSKMLMQSAVDGFNVCIFAYGQTGSGKTFTI
jgi:excinuclease UvrABC helicase subunit UvrB